MYDKTMKFIQVFFTTIVAIVISSFLSYSPQAISISQSLNKSEIAFEDSAMFEIVVSWEGDQQKYLFGKPLSPYFDRLKVRAFSSSVKTSSSGQAITTKTFKYVLIPTSSGQGKIDKIEIEYLRMPDSIGGILITEPMIINIADKIPVLIEEESGKTIYFILAGLLLAVAGTAFYIKEMSKKPVKLVRSPKEKVLEGLCRLKDSAGDDIKKFQSGLHDLLRDFLQENSNLNIADISDEKLKDSIETTDLSATYKEKIRDWLIKARRDKFQPLNSSPGETTRLESEVRELFEK